ncbi:MAG: hypothetical protein J6386_05025 [Candidatus Synoicihabitans palmerolidicus]|nr:hypothetical protein [Candidatus Synoicihabitans palmerolidicus]
MPRTLLGQTALYLVVMMLIGQVVWIVGGAIFFFQPLTQSFEEYLSATLTLAENSVESYTENIGTPPTEPIPLAHLDNSKIVPDSVPKPDFQADENSIVEEVVATLRGRFGPEVLIHEELGEPFWGFFRNESFIWVRFLAEGKLY